MGAGKSTIGKKVAALSGRPFVDVDREIERRHGAVAELFDRGEPEFRRVEEELAAEVLASSTPAVIAFGGGAVLSERTRELLLTAAFTLWVDVDVADAWNRVRDTGRPLARDADQFRRLLDERRPLYEAVSAGLVESADDVLLAGLEIEVGRGLLAKLADRLDENLDAVAVIGDEHVLDIHPLGFDPSAVLHEIGRAHV